MDSWAAEAARARGLQVVEHRPNLDGVRVKGEAARRYYERNAAIARDCDCMIAFPAMDRKGGTENAIMHAKRMRKPVDIR